MLMSKVIVILQVGHAVVPPISDMLSSIHFDLILPVLNTLTKYLPGVLGIVPSNLQGLVDVYKLSVVSNNCWCVIVRKDDGSH